MAAVDILKVSFEFSPKLGIRQLPRLSRDKESNIPGLFIVGDLADAPIIKVAINQGYDVARSIVQKLGALAADPQVHDVVVIGAGPAGIGAALALKEAGARFVVLEKERPFNTIQNFPKAKHIFSEPRSIESKGNFWFDDAQKEELIERWEQALDERALPIRQPEEVTDIKREGGIFTVHTKTEDGKKESYRARRIILAVGRRGAVNKLNVPGEGLDKVAYTLKDPEEHRGRRVLVVGGGDSAIEAAVACAESGAEVTLSYRGDDFSRAKQKNQEQVQALIRGGRIRAELKTTPAEIRADEVILKRGAESIAVPNDQVLVFIGTKLPAEFLKRLGIRMEGEMDWVRIAWIVSFALLTYLFYVLKAHKDFWPFGPSHVLHRVPELLKVNLGYRQVDAGFWGTCVYSFLITFFGIRAYRKYPQPEQKRRYMSLIIFQLLFLFGIPEVLAPLVTDHPWNFYHVSVPWPLSTWSLIDPPSWESKPWIAYTWTALGVLAAFVLIPLYVRKNGTRFCSYLCGCGGLAETLGDQWRHLAPRGSTAYKAEWFGKAILVLAVPVTLMTLNDGWRLIQPDSLHSAQQFAQNWYSLMVDFWLACVIGVAFYPYLGNRVWCRFFCPLRAWMELLSKWFSTITIKANDKCIGCGECTRFCQMGIEVQKFAQKQKDMDNTNSACIQCGICIQVCPMEVLSIGKRVRLPVLRADGTLQARPPQAQR